MHSTFEGFDDSNLGILLMDFLKLYGQTFNYDDHCISIENGGQCLHKRFLPQKWINIFRPSSLCFKDLLENNRYFGGQYFRILIVKQAFEEAYNSLSTAISLNHNGTICKQENSLLGRIIRF